jgi:phage-related minor tail protein
VGYDKIFTTCNFVSACRRWNKKETSDKTWANFKAYFAASHRQHNQMQRESSANSSYHAANADVVQTEDQMAETTIGALTNLATATATDRGVVATLTEVNSRLTRQLEDRSNELKDIKTLLKKERT